MRAMEDGKLSSCGYYEDSGSKGAPKVGLTAPRGERGERYHQKPCERHSRSPQGDVRCHNCKRLGHRQLHCPEPIRRSVSLVVVTPTDPEEHGRAPRDQGSRRRDAEVGDWGFPRRPRGRAPQEAWVRQSSLIERRCPDCRRPGHGWRRCPKREAERERVVLLVVSLNQEGHSRGRRVELKRS